MIGVFISSWLNVRSQPLRTATAIAGMIAAVMAVVLVDAASILSHDASEEYIARNFGLPATSSLTVTEGSPSDTEVARLLHAIEGGGFTVVSPSAEFSILIENSGRFLPESAHWVSADYSRIRIVDVIAGQWPHDLADSWAVPAVVSEAFIQSLGLTPANAIGQAFWFANATAHASTADPRTTFMRPFVINAVAASTTNAFGFSQLLLVTDDDLREYLPQMRPPGFLVRSHPIDFSRLQDVVATITRDSGQPIFTVKRVDNTTTLAPLLDQQRTTGLAVKTVTLAVGGLGIFAIGMAGVRERSREFGLIRALGASTGRVFCGVILQTLLEVFIAAMIAIPLAAVAVHFFARNLVLDTLPLPASTSLPMESALQGLIGAMLVAIVSGIVPATRAARMSVTQAMRG